MCLKKKRRYIHHDTYLFSKINIVELGKIKRNLPTASTVSSRQGTSLTVWFFLHPKLSRNVPSHSRVNNLTLCRCKTSNYLHGLYYTRYSTSCIMLLRMEIESFFNNFRRFCITYHLSLNRVAQEKDCHLP